MEQLTARTVVQYHDVVFLRLEEFLHLDQEGECYLFVDFALIDDQLCFSLQFQLLHELGRVELAVSPVSAHVDLAESPHADALQHLVGLQSMHFLILIAFEDALKR